MQTAAPAGSIAVSDATQRLCEGYFEFRALGPTSIKGLDVPVEVYEVVRAGPLRTHFQLSARRGLTNFVGREREMTAMAGALEQAKAGHGQIVAAVCEAGAGKSRLMYEFKATIPDRCKVLEAYSVSHGKASAWLPVLELLKNFFEIADGDDTDRRSEKVEAKARAKSPSVRHAPIAADSVALRRTARRSRGDFQVPSPISVLRRIYSARASFLVPPRSMCSRPSRPA